MRGWAIGVSVLISAGTLLADTPQERLNDAANVFQEIMSTPDKGIPQDLLGDAQCVIVIPGLKKAAFVVGGEYGRGFAMCRKAGGTGWSAPAALKMEGGSVGFQIGGSSTDLVMLVMNQHGMQKLMSNKFTLGADASVAAGPVGRTASARTDWKLNAEVLAWSRAKGAFAGIALNGAVLRPDEGVDKELYGRTLTSHEILAGNIAEPPGGRQLAAELDRYSMRKEGSSNADRSKR
jgi:lipid-binding SYLF domain-containing protein